MNENYRICPECEEKKPIEYFLPCGSQSQYSNHGRSYICIECLAKKLDKDNLGTIDKMCQFLDLPFNPDKWIEMCGTHDKLGPLLMDYSSEMVRGSHDCCDWTETNALWKKAKDYNTLTDNLTHIHADLLLFLKKKWGASNELTLDDYMKMEEYERHTLSHYPFKDEARKDVIRKLAKLSVLSDKCITDGNTKDAVSYLQAYNTLMKELGIGNEIAEDSNTINSLGELVAYIEKKGFLMNYHINENRDIVDKTIDDLKLYVRRLFNDSSETVHEMFNQKEAQKLSGTAIDDDDLDRIYSNDGEEDLEDIDVMTEEELEKMFGEVENGLR